MSQRRFCLCVRRTQVGTPRSPTAAEDPVPYQRSPGGLRGVLPRARGGAVVGPVCALPPQVCVSRAGGGTQQIASGSQAKSFVGEGPLLCRCRCFCRGWCVLLSREFHPVKDSVLPSPVLQQSTREGRRGRDRMRMRDQTQGGRG